MRTILVVSKKTEESSLIVKTRDELVQTEEETLYITSEKDLFLELKDTYPIAFWCKGEVSEAPWEAGYVLFGQDALSQESLEDAYLYLTHTPKIIAKTKRLIIRESTVEDVDAFYRIYEDPSTTAYMEPLFENPEEEKRYMESYITKVYGLYGYGIWTLEKKDSKEVIGRAGVSYKEGYEELEIGYVIAKEERRKGYASEAIEAILTYVKEEIGCKEVCAFSQTANISSKKVLKKMGFSYIKDVVMNGMVHAFYRKSL